VSQQSRRESLEERGLLHPRPEAVTAAVFVSGGPFFLSADKVQVKYEMLRSHYVDGVTAASAAAAHGYSRGGFYLVADAFSSSGMVGLLDERRGRKGPLKLSPEVVEFLRTADVATSAPALVIEAEERFGITLHRRTVERVRRRR
jgi:transposase